ncbi:DNA cytosine methyltransferase [Bacillus cereus]
MGLTFLDIFAGVGGFRLGMEQAGHRCIGYIKWDKFARASYQAIHNTEKEWTKHDINDVKPGELPKADVWCFGFPCQDVSIASGKATGLKGGVPASILEKNHAKQIAIKKVPNLPH